MKHKTIALAAGFIVAVLSGCGGMPRSPLPTAEYVDLSRFMGEWYVIAAIPLYPEKDAYNAVEKYQLAAPGVVDTSYRFRDGGFEERLKVYNSTGYVQDNASNAVWEIEFFWPLRADYRVMHVDKDYTVTLIGRQKRDYLWIMSRTPAIPDIRYQQMLALAQNAGYDIAKVRRVPQRWPEEES